MQAFRVKDGVAVCPARNLQLQIDLPAIDLPAADADHLASQFASNAQLFYTATPVTFATLARLKVAHVPSDLSTDYTLTRQYGSYGPLTSSASIAAGHIENNQHLHEADVALQVLGDDGQNVGWVKMPRLPRMEVVNPQGVEQHISLKASDAPKLDHTDEGGRIALAKLTARDLVTDAQTAITVQPKTTIGTGAGVGESWADVEWKMGSDGKKEWNPNFWIGTGEHKEWLWTKALFSPTVPLTGHPMKFVVTRLEVREKDEDGNWVERLYTTTPLAPNAVPTAATGQALQVIVVPAIDASAYLKFEPDTVTDQNNGIYKTQVTVLKDPDERLRHFIVELEDQGVFNARP